MTLDREKFGKLIALAESDNDHEALAAVRKAAAMARAAGLSLGEAVGGGGGLADCMAVLDRVEMRAEHAALRIERDGLLRRIGELERAAAAKKSRDVRYQEGRADGLREGRERADAEWMARDQFEAGRRAGFEAGAESERAATNRAYGRGFADGRAAVDATKASRGRKRA